MSRDIFDWMELLMHCSCGATTTADSVWFTHQPAEVATRSCQGCGVQGSGRVDPAFALALAFWAVADLEYGFLS